MSTDKVTRRQYGRYFEMAKRDDSTKYVRKTDDAPEELKDLVCDIHRMFDAISNDWIYETISAAFGELEETDIDDVTISTDVYSSNLYKWFGEAFADELIAEARDIFGKAEGDIYEQIGAGQWLAMRNIYQAVWEFIEEEEDLAADEKDDDLV